MRDRIVEIVEAYGVDGCIMDDLQDSLGGSDAQNSTISGLVTPLVKMGELYRNGDTKVGRSGRDQLVLRHKSFASVVPPATPAAEKSPVFKKGADWGLRRAAKILLANPVFKGTPEVRAIIKEIRELGV
jgi:hypothetical protein